MRFALDTPPMRAPSPKAGMQARAFQNCEAGRPIGIADYIIELLTYMSVRIIFHSFYKTATQFMIAILLLFYYYFLLENIISCQIIINAIFCILFYFCYLILNEKL